MKALRGSVTHGGTMAAVVALAFVALQAVACGGSPGADDNNNQNNGSYRCPSGYLLVPGGTFTMGVDAEDLAGLDGVEWSWYMGPAHKVTLSSDLCMSKTEVTVAEYRACLDTGGCTGEGPYPIEHDDRCNYSHTDQSRDSHPVNCVTYEQAQEYCKAQGGDLPTEAQWIRAAQGDDRRPFAWGSASPTCSLANFDVNGPGSEYENGEGCGASLVTPYTWTVGSAPAGASPYGLLDMTGNVFEYLLGCRTEFEVCDGDLGCVDPQPASCDGNVFRQMAGASAWNSRYGLYIFDRAKISDDYHAGLGMRCVTTPTAR